MDGEIESEIECANAKVVLIGESGVGKTCIVKQFTTKTFDSDCASSLSGQFNSKIISVGNKNFRFDLWDTAGQERYRSLAKIFYKDADIIIFVYDITNKNSYEALQTYWYDQVNSNCKPNAVYAVAGNKVDMFEVGVVKDEDAIKWADKIGAIFQLTSAKRDEGITQLFENAGKKFLNPDFDYKKIDEKDKQLYEKKKKDNKKKNNNILDSDEPNYKNIKLDRRNNKKNTNKKKKCC